MDARNWVLLITLSILWGGSFFFGEIALQALPPLTLVLCRVGFAALALVGLLYALRERLPTSRNTWRAFFMMGALNNLIPFTLIFWGQTQITSGLAAILNATTPLFTVVLAHFLTGDEKLNPCRIAGVLFGFFGVSIMIGPSALMNFGLYDIAQICVLCGAASYACAGIYGKRFKSQPPLTTAAGQLCASTMLMFPFTLIIDQPWRLSVPGPEIWLAVLGLAIFSTALAYIIYFRILSAAGASNLLLVTFLIPVSAILLGAIFLGESLDTKHGIGLALIGLGLAAIGAKNQVKKQKQSLQ